MPSVQKKLLTVIVIFCFANRVASSSIENELGFNPRLSTIPTASETSKTPVITVLGFPDRPNMYQGRFDTPTTFTVTFRFHNTCFLSGLQEGDYNPLTYLRAIHAVNMGQEPDATVLLYAVAQCYLQGHKKVHIFGNSRGGATSIKMLEMLSNPIKHRDAWQKIGITNPAQQTAIKNMVAAGRIYLAHPLMNYQTGIKLTATRIVHPLNLLTQWALNPVGHYGVLTSATINNTLLASTRVAVYLGLSAFIRLVSIYDTYSTNPIDTLIKHIASPNWNYTITIALAHQDHFVGKRHESLLYSLAEKFPKKLAITAGGPYHFDIKKSIKEFRSNLA